ncbi:prolyl oligopeptidase family serine peptidase [Streptomyces sp. PTM05]|uniref:Prolyl oligopeptidase family serine peptidase n=1 Tax=Streptantibioticus parmotrematis TaxID=2873249 RepID=A0ABS7QT39_9ACTN|nr:prolyl oligopeptidase family serine peptidase [Streptantibioticus parmotrematis]MBY8884969.1 prolyl oligopeptidase family serine peptidase [Streptantibioticus parmotrematis]
MSITPELLHGGWSPSAPAVSPDGRWVAWVTGPVVPRGAPHAALWVAPADGSASARRLTDGARRVSLPRWTADSGALIHLADGALVRVGLDGEQVALTEWEGWVGEMIALDGGPLVLLGEPDDQEPENGITVWTGDETPAGDRLMLLAPGDIAPRRLTAPGDRHVTAVAARPDGAALAVISWDEPAEEPGAFTARLHVVDPHRDTARDMGPLPLNASCPAWWHDGTAWHVALLGVTPPGPVGGLTVLDVTVPPPGLTPGPPRDLTPDGTICPVELVQSCAGPLALFADGLDTSVRRLRPATGDFEEIARIRGLASSLATDRDGGVTALRISGPQTPNDVFVLRSDGRPRQLSDTRPQFRDVDWGTQERLTWTAPDGLPLDGLLVLPPGRSRADGPLPLVALVHGGPYARYADALQFNAYVSAQHVAAGGYAVLLPNPRGSQGHGPAFAARVVGDLGGAELGDVLAGIDQLTADGVADPARLAIAGWSHGGYLAAWAAARTDRFRAAVVGAGIADWGMQTAFGELGREEAGYSGSHGWESPGPHPHDAVSPIGHAADITAPVLILHGEQDTNVPVAQAVYLHRALRHFGVPHEFVRYAGEGHIFSDPTHQADVMHRIRAFLDRHL